MPARLLLLRHGQSVWNAAGRWQGWADPPLSPLGEAQARSAGRHLADLGIERVATSNLQRARRTGELIASELGLGAVEVDEGLRERNVGDWSGLTTAEIEERWPGQIDAWRQGRLPSPPNGEADMVPRVLAALVRIAARGGSWLVVTHGGVIHAVDRRLGAEPAPIYNVCGRWLDANGTTFTPGEIVVMPEVDGPTTVL
jgi:broad specificity phosphatase PhoE